MTEKPLQNETEQTSGFTQNGSEQVTPEMENKSGGNINQPAVAEGITSKRNVRIFQLLLLLFSIAALAVIAVIEFSGNSSAAQFSTISKAWLENWDFVLLAMVCLLAVVFFESLAFFLLIGKTAKKWKPKLSVKTVCLGRYWDNITPSAVGGQPYQIYYLSKYRLPAGAASSVPIVFLFFRQLAFILMALVAVVFAGNLVSPLIFAAAILGASIMFLLPLGLVLFSLVPNFATSAVTGFLKILHKLKIVKDLEKTKEKIIKYLKEYIDSIKTMGKQVWFLLLILVLAVAAQAAMYSVPYFVIEASGHNGDFWNSLALALIASSAVSFIPTPGSSGAAESAFYLIFGVIEGGFIFWAMLLWRFITYYLPTLIGMGISLNDYIKRAIRSRRKLMEEKRSGNQR